MEKKRHASAIGKYAEYHPKSTAEQDAVCLNELEGFVRAMKNAGKDKNPEDYEEIVVSIAETWSSSMERTIKKARNSRLA